MLQGPRTIHSGYYNRPSDFMNILTSLCHFHTAISKQPNNYLHIHFTAPHLHINAHMCIHPPTHKARESLVFTV